MPVSSAGLIALLSNYQRNRHWGYDEEMMATLSINSEFSEQQTQHLQDIARNGSADEYGYGDNGQSNNFDELDPATLLQSLADFEHPASSSEALAFPDPPSEAPAASERHFQSLLQAVATANGEEAAQARSQNKPDATRSITSSQTATPKGTPKSKTPATSTKRKRRDIDYEDEDVGFIVTAKYKRQKKKKAQPDEEELLARERAIWGPDYSENDEDEVVERQPTIGTADARALGVHSAAALFRRPSAASKKYTRPPMSTVYTSLELNAEQFLHIQAAAKKYMLDENYPERSDCVGNRGKGDTDMTKLKLFGCVQSFLVDEGWGEKCWGASAPGAKTRKLKYPELMNKIISLVTPLMRRMVTNERQRLYATEARAAKGQQKKTQGLKRGKSQGPLTPTKEGTPRPNGDQRFHEPSPDPLPPIDPKLDQYHYNVDESSIAQQPSTSQAQINNVGPADGVIGAGDEQPKYLVNIMQDRRRLKPAVALTPTTCPDFFSLVQYVNSVIVDENLKSTSIKVLGPGLWLDIGNEDDWKHAIVVVEENEFMDGEVKCVVQVEEVGQ